MDPVLFATATSVLLIDQLTKYLVQKNLTLGQSWPSEGFLRLTHATNSGTAFGLFQNQTPILIVMSIMAIGFLVYFYRTQKISKPMLSIPIGLLLGGASGNLIDRLRSGTVVDFIDVGWWPIFNVADSSIVVGVLGLVSIIIFKGDDVGEASPPSTLQDSGTRTS